MIGEHCIYRLVIPYAKRQPSHSCWKTSHLMFFSQVGGSNTSTLLIPNMPAVLPHHSTPLLIILRCCTAGLFIHCRLSTVHVHVMIE